MRMWMIFPEHMCRKHLLGEHVECHMLLGCLRKGKNIDGFLEKRIIEPQYLWQRHELLSREMKFRGYRHKSPMNMKEVVNLVKEGNYFGHTVNIKEAMIDLYERCPECRKRMPWSKKKK